MSYIALNTAATGLSALSTSLDVTANNLANANTTGFKSSRVNFEDLFYQEFAQPGLPGGDGIQRATGLYVGLGTQAAGTQASFWQTVPGAQGRPFSHPVGTHTPSTHVEFGAHGATPLHSTTAHAPSTHSRPIGQSALERHSGAGVQAPFTQASPAPQPRSSTHSGVGAQRPSTQVWRKPQSASTRQVVGTHTPFWQSLNRT
jgi:hypothetical protein